MLKIGNIQKQVPSFSCAFRLPPRGVALIKAGGQEALSPRAFAGLLALLIFLLFPDVLLGLRTFVFRDFGLFSYPLAHYFRESFWRGEVPLWNPLSNCGIPFLGQWNTLVCYPFSLFYLLFPLSWGLGVFCLLHLFLAGMGMYYLVHRWTNHRLAACVAALGFAFNGMTINCLMWPHIMVALGWMPWVFYWVENAWQRGGRTIVVASIVGTLQMLSGGPEVVLFTWVLIGSLWVRDWFRHARLRLQLISRLMLVVLIISGLAAIQLVPFFDLLLHSQRHANYASTYSSMPSWGWANFIVPLFHCFRSPPGVYFQEGQIWTSSYYLGIGFTAFALVAAVLVRDWRVGSFSFMSALSLVLALGEHGFLYAQAKRFLPIIGVMNFPIKFLLVPVFCTPVLAAFAVREALTVNSERRLAFWRLTLGSCITLVMFAAGLVWFAHGYPVAGEEWHVTSRSGSSRTIFLILEVVTLYAVCRAHSARLRLWLGLTLLLVLFFDLLTHCPNQNPTVIRSIYGPEIRPTIQINPKPGHRESRILVSRQAMARFDRSVGAEPLENYAATRLALCDDCNLLESIPKVDGFYSLYILAEREVLAHFYFATNAALPKGMADFLGISQVTSDYSYVEWRSRNDYMPLVTGGQQPVYVDGPDIWKELLDSKFDPRRTVYLPTAAALLVEARGPSKVSIVSVVSEPHRLMAEIEAKAPSMVVIAQTYYHPWKAYIDNRPTRLWRANYAFQALEVPKGRHHVKLVYEDLGFFSGTLVSVLTLVSCIAFWFWRRTCQGSPG
jgi:hypothetical protein